MVYSTADVGKDLDPDVVVYVNGVVAMRRIMAKWPNTREQIAKIAAAYHRSELPGLSAQCPNRDYRYPNPAPPQDMKDGHSTSLGMGYMGGASNSVADYERRAAEAAAQTPAPVSLPSEGSNPGTQLVDDSTRADAPPQKFILQISV